MHAVQYHIVILPTFRDEHAELVQYLLQLPRLQKQRFFLTQHNPGVWVGGQSGDVVQAAGACRRAVLRGVTCPPHLPLLLVASGRLRQDPLEVLALLAA